MHKKTLIGRVVLKGNPDKIPDFGMGKGVIYQQEITFTDERRQGFKTPLFAVALLEHEDRMIREMVEVKWEEKTNARKKRV